MKEYFTGIDIGQSGIRIAEIERNRDVLSLNKLISTEYEEELIKEGMIVDPEKMANLLNDLLDSNGISRRYVVSNIFPERILARRVQIPQMPYEEIRNALKYLSVEELPFDIEEVDMDYSVVGELERDGELSLDVVIFVTKKDTLSSIVSILKGAKIKNLMIIDIEYLALLYTLDLDLNEGENNVLLRMGKYSTDVCLLKGDNVILVRNMPYGGEEMTRRIMEEMGLDEKESKALIKKCSDLDDTSGNEEQEDKAIDIILDYLREFTTELFKVLTYFRVQLEERDATFNNIIIAGRGGYFRFLPSFLMNMDVFDDFGSPNIFYWRLKGDLFSIDPGLRMTLGNDSLSFSTAISLAYRGATEEW